MWESTALDGCGVVLDLRLNTKVERLKECFNVIAMSLVPDSTELVSFMIIHDLSVEEVAGGSYRR